MKKNIIMLFILLISFYLFSSDTSSDASGILKKIKATRACGIALTCIGATTLLSGFIFDGFFIFNQAATPGSILLYSSNSTDGYYNYSMSIYFNPICLCLNISGIVLTIIGISQLAWSGYKEKRLKKQHLALFENIIPEMSYNINNNKINLGLNILL